MKKWAVTLSTTEPFNYVGLLKVRQGNKQSEVLEATITENGLPMDLTGCRVAFQTKIGDLPIERNCRLLSEKGMVEYIFDDYTMQKTGRQTANLVFYKGDHLIGTTQNFEYVVIQAVSRTPGEMGSYWQTAEELMTDMKEYLNTGKGTFEEWFDSVKDILKTVDPGGTLLKEVIDSRTDSSGVPHASIKERLQAEFVLMERTIHDRLYTLPSIDTATPILLQDDRFSTNHQLETKETVEDKGTRGALVIATIGTSVEDTFHFEKVGEING